MSDERLTYRELAMKLRVKPSTIRFWQRQGLPYLPCGRLRFYKLLEVENWLRERDQTKRREA